ncbi:hypothetical protein A1O3_05399 [Capronia epimyces CBS 606.96]|uniref:Xylanolytic transcriptional activator regulatory domain-containing protein n=1 Tax=Capronia epimyces CBS 606.96 TaxID=1182542 RepID=W9XWV9_9EURO|nr:uncharacterized protein A1O3_05399 [Capronia epimyces CBS 606.96]EXJ84728.1 hypothetical protein A1O3_05399 [Capronia epimyces CBS 606.96]
MIEHFDKIADDEIWRWRYLEEICYQDPYNASEYASQSHSLSQSQAYPLSHSHSHAAPAPAPAPLSNARPQRTSTASASAAREPHSPPLPRPSIPGDSDSDPPPRPSVLQVDDTIRTRTRTSIPAAVGRPPPPPAGAASTNLNRDWELLPPIDEVIEGCKVFTTSYFQLGFIPKANFFERLSHSQDRHSISVFLLLSILSISARFTPRLVQRYGRGSTAPVTDVFLERAASMVPDQMYRPSLDAIQAFFLLSLAEWGRGDGDPQHQHQHRHRSAIHMGIAVRMAGMLHLHREETYQYHCLESTTAGVVSSAGATADQVVNAEMARRTFWMLENHDNLHSGHNSPVCFPLGDITTLLPCDEQDFAFGVVPAERAALMGTPPAIQDPRLTRSPSRSLFASLIQSHNLWGQVARRVAGHGNGSDNGNGNGNGNGNETSTSMSASTSTSVTAPYYNDTNTNITTTTTIASPGLRLDLDKTHPHTREQDYLRLSTSLHTFERNLPPRHTWSVWNLRGFKAQGLDLAYLSVVMMIKLSNIVLRRSYLQGLGLVADHDHNHDQGHSQGHSQRHSQGNSQGQEHNSSAGAGAGTAAARPSADTTVEAQITAEMFENMITLHEQIEAFFSLSSPDQGFPAFIVFCIYICGSLANHLLQRPRPLDIPAPGPGPDPDLDRARARTILEKSTAELDRLQDAWPMARCWSDALNKARQLSRHRAAGPRPSTPPPVAGDDIEATTTTTGRASGAIHQSSSHFAQPVGLGVSERPGFGSGFVGSGSNGGRDHNHHHPHHHHHQRRLSSLVVQAQPELDPRPQPREDPDPSVNNVYVSASASMDDLAYGLASTSGPDPWADMFTSAGLTNDNFDSELAFYLWPGLEA